MSSIDKIMIIVGLIALIFFFLYVFVMYLFEKCVAETEIIRVEPIVKKQAESTGCSVGYGKYLTYHEHYRYRNVKVGDRVTFRIKWNNGSFGTVTCKKDGETFNRLYPKLKR
jgi:hypothetical protein